MKNVNKNNAVHAIVFEAVAVAISLEEPELLTMGVALLAKFLSVREPNLKYLALENMARLAEVPAVVDTGAGRGRGWWQGAGGRAGRQAGAAGRRGAVVRLCSVVGWWLAAHLQLPAGRPGLAWLPAGALTLCRAGRRAPVMHICEQASVCRPRSGLSCLLLLVRLPLPAVNRHQKTIIACLRDPDISIRRRALDLLFIMCTPENSADIVEVGGWVAGRVGGWVAGRHACPLCRALVRGCQLWAPAAAAALAPVSFAAAAALCCSRREAESASPAAAGRRAVTL